MQWIIRKEDLPMATELSSEGKTIERAQKVKGLLARSGNCAQTSFAVLQEEFNLDGKQILRALTPFPGIALRGETCGAVVGCLMAIGLIYGRDNLDDWKEYLASLPPSRRFCRRFVEQNGSTACSAILEAKLGRPFDLADREQAFQYAASGGPKVCEGIIASGVQIAAEVINRKV